MVGRNVWMSVQLCLSFWYYECVSFPKLMIYPMTCSNWEFFNNTHSSCEVLTAKENSLLIVIKCVGPVLCLCTGWNLYSFRPLCEQCKSEVDLSLWITSCWSPWCWCKLSVMVVVSYWVLIFTCIFKAMHVFWNLNTEMILSRSTLGNIMDAHYYINWVYVM